MPSSAPLQSGNPTDRRRRGAQCYLQNLARQSTAAVILATGNSQIKFLEALIALGGRWSRLALILTNAGIDASR